ncbi:hypothetical protein Tco_1020459 [Tanacetum coccineum]
MLQIFSPKLLMLAGKSKEVGTPRYLSLVVPLKKVGDEAVHKELGDRMERAATTASSLEAEQDSALIDKKKMIITESSIRSDLHLDDAEVFINQQLGDMSHHKKIFVNPSHTKKFFANMKREGKDFSRRVTPLFDTMLVQASEEVAEVAQDETVQEESVPTPSNDPLPSSEDSMQLNDLMLLCSQLQKQVLDLEKAKSDQAIEIASLKKRVDKLEKRRKFRTYIHGRRIEDIDADADVTLVNETQERQDEDLMFDTRVLDGDEMFVDATTNSAAPTIPTTVEETLAQTLVEIKATKPKAKGIIFHDLEKQVSKPIVSIIQPLIKDKGKGIMQESERPLTKKDQVTLDEDLARNVQA